MIAYPLPPSLTHSLAHPLTHSPTHSLTHPGDETLPIATFDSPEVEEASPSSLTEAAPPIPDNEPSAAAAASASEHKHDEDEDDDSSLDDDLL